MDRTTAAILAANPTLQPATVVDIRNTFRVHVILADPDGDRKETATLLLLMLGKLFGKITTSENPAPFLVNAPRSVVNRVRVNPGGRSEANLVISLQDAPITETVPVLYVSSRGWTAYLSTDSPWGAPRVATNSLGAHYAAALAAAEVFNRAFGALLPQARILKGTRRACLIEAAPDEAGTLLPAIPQVVELDLLVVGIGAVGQTVVHSLAALPQLTGRLTLLDHEPTAPENADRYLYAGDQYNNKSKSHLGRELLARHPFLKIEANVRPPAQGHVAVNVQPTWWAKALSVGASGWNLAGPFALVEPLSTYAEFRMAEGTEPRRVAVAAVDSTQARIDLQFGFHKWVLNPWTDTDRAIRAGNSVHEIGEQACIACLYHSPRRGPPDRYEFYSSLIGWDVERTRLYLDDQAKVLDRATIEELCHGLGLNAAEHLHQIGKRLQAFIDAQCAQATLRESDRLGTSPVIHAAVLAGIWATAAIVLEAMQEPIPGQVEFDLLRAQLETKPLPTARTTCLCQDGRIQTAAKDAWR